MASEDRTFCLSRGRQSTSSQVDRLSTVTTLYMLALIKSWIVALDDGTSNSARAAVAKRGVSG